MKAANKRNDKVTLSSRDWENLEAAGGVALSSESRQMIETAVNAWIRKKHPSKFDDWKTVPSSAVGDELNKIETAVSKLRKALSTSSEHEFISAGIFDHDVAVRNAGTEPAHDAAIALVIFNASFSTEAPRSPTEYIEIPEVMKTLNLLGRAVEFTKTELPKGRSGPKSNQVLISTLLVLGEAYHQSGGISRVRNDITAEKQRHSIFVDFLWAVSLFCEKHGAPLAGTDQALAAAFERHGFKVFTGN